MKTITKYFRGKKMPEIPESPQPTKNDDKIAEIPQTEVDDSPKPAIMTHSCSVTITFKSGAKIDFASQHTSEDGAKREQGKFVKFMHGADSTAKIQKYTNTGIRRGSVDYYLVTTR